MKESKFIKLYKKFKNNTRLAKHMKISRFTIIKEAKRLGLEPLKAGQPRKIEGD